MIPKALQQPDLLSSLISSSAALPSTPSAPVTWAFAPSPHKAFSCLRAFVPAAPSAKNILPPVSCIAH